MLVKFFYLVKFEVDTPRAAISAPRTSGDEPKYILAPPGTYVTTFINDNLWFAFTSQGNLARAHFDLTVGKSQFRQQLNSISVVLPV